VGRSAIVGRECVGVVRLDPHRVGLDHRPGHEVVRSTELDVEVLGLQGVGQFVDEHDLHRRRQRIAAHEHGLWISGHFVNTRPSIRGYQHCESSAASELGALMEPGARIELATS